MTTRILLPQPPSTLPLRQQRFRLRTCWDGILFSLLLTTFLPTAVNGSAVAAAASPLVGALSSTPKTTPTTTDMVALDPTFKTPMMMDPAAASSSSGPNVVVQLANYLKDSVVRTVTGCGQLWSNHQQCNEIRKKQSVFRAQLQHQWEAQNLYETESRKQVLQRLQREQGGITYDEYIFLRRGKEDRGKVLNLSFLIWGAPRFLPYALMFNPEMLPSPFQADKAMVGESSVADTLSRERAQAVLSTLMIMEKQAVAVSRGYLSNLNIFGKKKQHDKKQDLAKVVTETGEVFRRSALLTAPSAPTATHLLERFAPYLYRVDIDFNRAEQRLCHVPACIVQGIGRAVLGQGVPGVVAQLTPAFLHRGKLIGHIQKVAAADNFLVQANIDLDTVPQRLIQEACQERLMDAGPHRSLKDLRASLNEWLQLTTAKPSLANFATVPPLMVAPVETESDVESNNNHLPWIPVVYYNGNLARMVLMAYYGCAAARDSRCASRLPQLLYKGGSESQTVDKVKGSSTSSIHDASGRTKEAKKSFIPFLRN